MKEGGVKLLASFGGVQVVEVGGGRGVEIVLGDGRSRGEAAEKRGRGRAGSVFSKGFPEQGASSKRDSPQRCQACQNEGDREKLAGGDKWGKKVASGERCPRVMGWVRLAEGRGVVRTVGAECEP